MTELEDKSEVIGRYELLTRLATGGMAELFLARERGLAGLERLVVIKRILPHLADQPSFVEMFLREARIVARLSHPNVVQIYELGQEEDSYHIAMEYIHGSTVRELLLLAQQEGKQMPLDVGLTIVEQTCRGLHAAHQLRDLDGQPLGLVHRDISPHNLMCTTDGHVKLLDFGVAKSTAASVEATYSGNLKGKFAYLSPEQCLHEPLDRRSDIFAMGIVMWEMFTMRRLFKRKTELDMMQAVIGGKVPPPQRFREDLPTPIQEVILRALATEREDRFDSAETLREAMAEAASECGVEIEEDRVARFLSDVAGERLAERQATVESACERELTVAERRRLLHMTGTSSRSATGGAEQEEMTAVETPSGAMDKTHLSPAEKMKELVDADRRLRTGTGSRTEKNTRPSVDGVTSQQKRIAGAALVTLVLGAIIAVVVGVGLGTDDGQAEAISVSGEPIPLGWAPTIDPDVLVEEVAPLHDYLERTTGRPVPLKIADDYSGLSRMLRNGEVVVAMLPPTLYVLTTMQDEEIDILAMREFDGTASSDGHLLVRRGEGIQSLEDLRGETFCFVDRASTSGHLFPRHYIRGQGFDPDEFIGEIHWSGDHFQGMRDLLAGKCQAAAVYSGAYLSADEYDIRTGQVGSLALTGQLPQDVIAAKSGIDPDDRQLLLDALVNFDPEEEYGIRRLGKNQRITGFLVREDSDFDSLRAVVEQEGLSITDL